MVGGMLAFQSGQPLQVCFNRGQLIAQCKWEESLCGAALAIIRTELAPAAQQAIFVAWFCTEVMQALAKLGGAHGSGEWG